ncbi:hypothetical protein WJX82_003975 [Trebouxia sp. C0006]
MKAMPVKHREVLAVAAGSDDTAAGPVKKTSGVAKLRARMESLQKHTRPEQDLAPATRDLASSTDLPRPVPEVTFSSSQQQSDRLQSSSGASANHLTNLATAADPSVVAHNKPHLPSRTSASSLGWDRRFRNAGVSAHLVNDKAVSQPSDPAPKEDAAAAERSLHQKDARSVAQVKADPDLGAQEEDPWDWNVAEAAAQTTKKSRTKVSKAKAEENDAVLPNKKAKKLDSTKPASKPVKAIKQEAADSSAGAFPDLTNAPTHGPDEPLLLEYGSTHEGIVLSLSVPATINMYLRDYQRDGVRFLFRQYAQKQGGILGDDMGLGKTVQTIAFCAALLQKTGTPQDSVASSGSQFPKRCPILIVAPTSVLTNWQREFNTWGAFQVALCHGKQEVRATMLQGVQNGQFEILITSYDTFRRNIEDMLRIPWHVAVFDEAHKLKNRNAKIHEACCQLDTKLRYGLTGTAMQNDYDELFNLLDWAVPGGLGDRKQFHLYYEGPIKMAQKKDVNEAALGKGRSRQTQLNALVDKFLLRRTKDSTIKDQLPRKTDNIVFCEMSLLQHRAYERTLDSPDFQLLLTPLSTQTVASGTSHMGVQGHACTALSVSYCPASPSCRRFQTTWNLSKVGQPLAQGQPLLPGKVGNPQDQQDRDVRRNMKYERDTAVAELVLGEDVDKVGGAGADNNFMTLSDSSTCGKMTALAKLLDLWYQQETANQVLVFSHSVRMLDIIEHLVIMTGYVYMRLDGSTKQQDRQTQVDQFNNSASVFLFLISTTAGGLGLNLTSANRVVIVDPSWNPAHDLQAQDRAFRIGQRRDVGVYRLVSTGTLEEMVYARQIYKQQAANTAIEGARERRYFEGVKGVPGQEGELWGLANLFKLTAETVATRDIIVAAEQKELSYSIEAFDVANAVLEGPLGTDVADLDPAAEELEVEDPGLRDLAIRLTENALHQGSVPPDSQAWGMGDEQGGRGNAVTAAVKPVDAPGVGSGQQPMTNGMDTEMQLLQEGGMLATHRHESILGGSRVEQMLSNAAEQRASGQQPAAAPGLSSAGRVAESDNTSSRLNVVELLATWKHVSVEQMAQTLLGMTAAERTQLRNEYTGQ